MHLLFLSAKSNPHKLLHICTYSFKKKKVYQSRQELSVTLPKKKKTSPPGEKKHESAGACELSGLFEETSTLPKRQGSSPPCLIRLRLRSRNTNRQSHRFSNWDPVSAGRETSSCSLGCYELCRTRQCTSANRTSFSSFKRDWCWEHFHHKTLRQIWTEQKYYCYYYYY